MINEELCRLGKRLMKRNYQCFFVHAINAESTYLKFSELTKIYPVYGVQIK